jgi:hypothetical protein
MKYKSSINTTLSTETKRETIAVRVDMDGWMEMMIR